MRHYKLTSVAGATLLLASAGAALLNADFEAWATGLLGGLFLTIGVVETWLDRE